ncbi:MAG: NAD-glutamate dehydrogenase, partial [Betaproteobacteria bacterium HGW-Betaproteobacteria-10]
MFNSSEKNDPNPLTAVCELIQKRLPADDAAIAEAFTQRYYAQVASEDLAERSTQDLYGAALSHWHFARRFNPGASRLRVYNPRPEEHGWQSTHTIIEIVSEDMPFLVDSITMEVNRQGLTVHLIIHPLMRMRRDGEGNLLNIADGNDEADGMLESIIHVEVDRRTDPAHLDALQQGLARILGDVHAAVGDWPVMRQRLADLVAELESTPPPIDAAEDIAFLNWLAAGNFTLLGYREYSLLGENGGAAEMEDCVLRIVPGTGAGILRETGQERSVSFAILPPEVKKIALEPCLLVLTKANARSTVHRPGYLDYVGVKRIDKDGKVIGEQRFLGLFTANAYSASPEAIPLLRQKVRKVLDRAELRAQSHGGRALSIILEQYPRDELFQIEPEQLYTVAMGILGLGERQRTRLFVRRDTFGRFFSCLIYAPRENYDTALRQRMQNVLMAAFDGTSSEFNVQVSESALARILIIVHTQPGSMPAYDVAAIERCLVHVSRRWEDELFESLRERCGEERGNLLHARYLNAFPAGYREDYEARAAVGDIELMESLSEANGLAMSLYVPLEAPAGSLRFKVLRDTAPVPLSASLPMLEHMGVRVIEERPYEIERADRPNVWLHDFGLSYQGAEELD